MRERGTVRTSTRRSTPASPSSAISSPAVRVECPIVKSVFVSPAPSYLCCPPLTDRVAGSLLRRLLVDRVTEKAVFDMGAVDVAEGVDEVAPRVGDSADPGDEGNDAADLQPLGVYRPAADQERPDDLQLGAK